MVSVESLEEGFGEAASSPSRRMVCCLQQQGENCLGSLPMGLCYIAETAYDRSVHLRQTCCSGDPA